MAYLISFLFPMLLIAALFGALAGWCWHCIRNKERVDKLIAARDRLRGEFATMTPSLPGMRGLGLADPELEAAQMRADVAVSKVVELERDRADLLDERNRLSLRANELEMALAAARTNEPDASDLRLRFAALEDERDAALRELEASRMQWSQERAQWALAAPEVDMTAPEPDLETRANAWRVRLLEGRTEYLESRLNAARATPPREDPRLAVLTGEKAVLEEETARLRAELEALQARLVITATPQAPDNDLNLLRWQSRYLSQRVKYLEDRERSASAILPSAGVEPVMAPAPDALDVELLNRRAWRQRYLEARLAFYEGRWTEDRSGRLAAVHDLQARQALIEALQSDVLAERSANEENQARIADLEGQLAERSAALTAATAVQQTIAAERDAAHNRLVEIDGLNAEIARLKQALAAFGEQEGALTALRSRLRDAEEAARTLAGTRATLAEREAEIARLRDQPKPSVDESEVMHLRFRTRYLDDRVKFLEARLAADPAPRAAAPVRQTFMPAEPSAEEVRPMALPAARGGAPDDLRLIAGVSPRIESTLNSLGVYHFDQIAAWSSENVSWIERYLAFKGRIGREQWVEQARRLAEQDGRDAARRFREDETV